MSTSSNRDLKIEDVLAFNHHLQMLADACLPIELGFEVSGEPLSQSLSHICSRIALQNALGKTVEQAISEAPSIPQQYRASLFAWTQNEKSPASVAPLNAIGKWKSEITARFVDILLQPLILLALVYCGLVYLVLTFVPQLEEIYFQLRQTPGKNLSTMMAVRDWLPIWGPGIPIIGIVAALIWRMRYPISNLVWLPVCLNESGWISKANQAENLAQFEEASIHSESNSESSPVSTSPLMTWATTCSEDHGSRADALRFVSRAYRESSKWRIVRWTSFLPIVFGVFLGGILVLGFGLSLFSPLIELLVTLSRP